MSKKITSLAMLLSLALAIFSQNIPFPENNAVWKESHTTIAGPMPTHFALCGDTLINGTSYSQLLALQMDTLMQVNGMNFLAGLRQQNSLVYALFDGAQNEILLYDFTLEAGDEISLTLPFSVAQLVRKVDSTSVEMFAGQMRKVIYFANQNPSCDFPPEFWIEGVGSSYGVWLRAFDPCTVADAGGQLLCYGHGQEYLNLTLIECFLPELTGCGLTNAVNDEVGGLLDMTIFPNPSSDMISINAVPKSIGTKWECSVFNSFGEIMTGPLKSVGGAYEMDVAHFPKGIYFIKILDKENREMGFGKFFKM